MIGRICSASPLALTNATAVSASPIPRPVRNHEIRAKSESGRLGKDRRGTLAHLAPRRFQKSLLSLGAELLAADAARGDGIEKNEHASFGAEEAAEGEVAVFRLEVGQR